MGNAYFNIFKNIFQKLPASETLPENIEWTACTLHSLLLIVSYQQVQVGKLTLRVLLLDDPNKRITEFSKTEIGINLLVRQQILKVTYSKNPK